MRRPQPDTQRWRASRLLCLWLAYGAVRPRAAAVRHIGQLHRYVVGIGQKDLFRLSTCPHARLDPSIFECLQRSISVESLDSQAKVANVPGGFGFVDADEFGP